MTPWWAAVKAAWINPRAISSFMVLRVPEKQM